MSDRPDERSPADVRRDIETTREQLADTAAALAQKADVKARAHERVDEVKDDLRSRVNDVRETISGKAQEVKEKVASDPAGSAGTAGMAGTMPHATTADPAAGTTGLGPKAAAAGQAAGHAAETAREQVRSHPLPAAAIAAALLGFALGYLAARR